MKLYEVMKLADDRKTEIMMIAAKKKKNNSRKSKTTKIDSFIDVFGGMAGYPTASEVGRGFQVG